MDFDSYVLASGYTDMIIKDLSTDINNILVYPNVLPKKQIHVKQDGTGDFTTITDAITSTTDASITNVYEIIIHEGTYIEYNWSMKKYVELRGINRDKCILTGGCPIDMNDSGIIQSAGFWWKDSGKISNLTIKYKNVKYPIHCDNGNSITDYTQIIENCYIEHLGNQEIIDFRKANNLSYSGVWTGYHAWGCGMSSGAKVYAYNTTFKSPTTPFYFHNNVGFTKPCYTELNNCKCISTALSGAIAMSVDSMGSTTDDILVLNGCKIIGQFLYNNYEPVSTHVTGKCNINILGHANSDFPFSVYSPSDGTIHPGTVLSLQDKQVILTNTSTSTITRGMIVCYNTNLSTIKAMGISDNINNFVGIAMEDISIGSMGKIQTKGKFFGWDLCQDSNSSGKVFGDNISISSTDVGKLTKNGTVNMGIYRGDSISEIIL